DLSACYGSFCLINSFLYKAGSILLKRFQRLLEHQKLLFRRRRIGMNTRSRHKAEAPQAELPQKLIAYQIYEDDFAPIRPARRERKWMDDADQKAPYRCLPLVMANQYGWEILSTHHFRARWNGTSKPDGIYIENLCGDGVLHCQSHFGEGVLTFQLPFIFKTPEGWKLMVRGPMNNPKD